MRLSQRNYSKYIYAVIMTNLCMSFVIYFGIKLYTENKDIANVIGVVIFTIFLLALDVLYIYISKHIFAVYVENDAIKLKSFNKVLNEIKLTDIKFIYFNYDTVHISSEVPCAFDNEHIKEVVAKKTIYFRISKENIKYLFSYINVSKACVCNKIYNSYVKEIEKYAEIVRIGK